MKRKHEQILEFVFDLLIAHAIMPHRTLSEFALIARYFQRSVPLRHAVLGVGDDCALLQPPAGELLAISTDTLVAGRHFFDDVDPAALGHKALAVNLSDLGASGAQPLACTLALTVPVVDDAWLAAFARGLYALADASGCELIGGDTTCGPLSITLTVWAACRRGRRCCAAVRAQVTIFMSATMRGKGWGMRGWPCTCCRRSTGRWRMMLPWPLLPHWMKSSRPS